MRIGFEYYQVQVLVIYENKNVYKTLETNDYKTSLEGFKALEKSLKTKNQKYVLTFCRISRGVLQVIKTRSSDSESIDSPLF